MKRLVDETTDELTRSLLSAGIEHRPPPGNQGRVLMAIGAGSALGLFSSNAFAWLGTTAGKLTAVSVVAVGVAGAVFAVAPGAENQQKVASGSSITAPSQPSSAARAMPAFDVSRRPGVENTAEENTASDVDGAEQGAPDERVIAEADARTASKARNRLEHRASRARKRTAKSAQVAEGAEVAEDLPAQDRASLDAEVRLVDDMRSAARRKDRAGLERLIATYRADFPEGQLGAEVSEFAARLERSEDP